MFDVGDRDLPVPTSGNWVIKGCMTKCYVLHIFTFFWKSKTTWLFTFFEMFHTFFFEHWFSMLLNVVEDYKWRSRKPTTQVLPASTAVPKSLSFDFLLIISFIFRSSLSLLSLSLFVVYRTLLFYTILVCRISSVILMFYYNSINICRLRLLILFFGFNWCKLRLIINERLRFNRIFNLLAVPI